MICTWPLGTLDDSAIFFCCTKAIWACRSPSLTHHSLGHPLGDAQSLKICACHVGLYPRNGKILFLSCNIFKVWASKIRKQNQHYCDRNSKSAWVLAFITLLCVVQSSTSTWLLCADLPYAWSVKQCQACLMFAIELCMACAGNECKSNLVFILNKGFEDVRSCQAEWSCGMERNMGGKTRADGFSIKLWPGGALWVEQEVHNVTSKAAIERYMHLDQLLPS